MSTTRINPHRRNDRKYAVQISFASRGNGIGSSPGRTFHKLYSAEKINDLIANQGESDEVYIGYHLLTTEDTID